MSTRFEFPDLPSRHHLPFHRPFEKPIDEPFDKLRVLSEVDPST
jgi:hypothetical protein